MTQGLSVGGELLRVQVIAVARNRCLHDGYGVRLIEAVPSQKNTISPHFGALNTTDTYQLPS